MDEAYLAAVCDPTQRFDFAANETRVADYWRAIDAFQTSQRLNADKPKFTFYDGPPFATGLPHYGHLLAGSIKDIVTRFAHQTGHSVERRFGWDTHGLPVETEIDKKLEIRGAADVERIGIATYNEECRAIVMRYSAEWRVTVERMGRWIDFDRPYKTMDASFMESVWWVFGQLWKSGKVYRGTKVMPYSTPLATPLSNFEANQNYKDVADPAVTVAFRVKGDADGAALLAWTTTPWTLPSNLALCVHPEFEYSRVRDLASGSVYIFLEKRKEAVFESVKRAKYEVLATVKGAELVGLEYEPLFEYFAGKGEFPGAFRVVADTYVTDESGTGIVHQAPAFGEDDHRIALAHGIVGKDAQPPCPLDVNARFAVPGFPGSYLNGLHVKEADDKICADLKARGLLVKKGVVNHSYPFCWRTDTPLIYRTIPSWFVRVEDATQRLLANNAQSRWVPEFVQEKRFANWLESARDWAISRNRYWGTPIPLWVNVADDADVLCVASIAELERLTGAAPGSVTDLHRHFVDDMEIVDAASGKRYRRVPEVFDCWFESGSMPYAQNHYPFAAGETEESFLRDRFPADFVAEGIDQTRGWFYTLLVLSTLLFDRPPARNVIVNGLVLAKDGKKMSKRLKNYPEPGLVIDRYGADILRLYLINSPVVRAETLKFSEDGVRDLLRDALIPWLNAFRFWRTQVAVFERSSGSKFVMAPSRSNVLDKWILASLASLIRYVRAEMAAYRLYTVVPRLLRFIEELTNWYIRFNRRRLKGDSGAGEARAALSVLGGVLRDLSVAMAPFTPFIAETFYQVMLQGGFLGDAGSTDKRSVHFLPFPEADDSLLDPAVLAAVQRMQDVIVAGRTVRDRRNVPLKTPLRELVVFHADPAYHESLRALEGFVREELNVKLVTYTSDEERCGVKYRALPDWKALGTKHKADLRKIRAGLAELSSGDFKEAMRKGTVDVGLDGLVLAMEDVQIIRSIDRQAMRPADWADFEHQPQGEAHVLLDMAEDAELAKEAAVREAANRLQKLRKALKLSVLDEMQYFWAGSAAFGTVLAEQREFLLKTLRQDILPKADAAAEKAEMLGEETFSVLGGEVTLYVGR